MQVEIFFVQRIALHRAGPVGDACKAQSSGAMTSNFPAPYLGSWITIFSICDWNISTLRDPVSGFGRMRIV